MVNFIKTYLKIDIINLMNKEDDFKNKNKSVD